MLELSIFKPKNRKDILSDFEPFFSRHFENYLKIAYVKEEEFPSPFCLSSCYLLKDRCGGFCFCCTPVSKLSRVCNVWKERIGNARIIVYLYRVLLV